MRKLKFRAWDGKEMHNNYSLSRFFGSITDNIPVMQFIGRKDKNGKDIYEGDLILLVVPMSFCTSRIQDNRFIAEVKYDGKNAGFYFSTNIDAHHCIKPWMARDIEIIGNAYENNELTKRECQISWLNMKSNLV